MRGTKDEERSISGEVSGVARRTRWERRGSPGWETSEDVVERAYVIKPREGERSPPTSAPSTAGR